eukprot:TRINITY_DN156_c0_g1_i2.p1 TRINITY_DN156_c0_g1~~TRINITY_DN156_c0_g1_i2.p1  ORF type:complete len:213 (-),score=28.82 TRINITY_DN156_c0_g1_i2:150-788(-)
MSTVIIHPSQSTSEITRLLSSKHKIKVSTDPNILPHYIFNGGVAFIVIDFEKDVYDGFSSLVNRVVSFGKQFKGSYMIARVSSETLHLLNRLQLEIAAPRPWIIPCDSSNNHQVVDAITTVLLTYSKESSEAVYIRALLDKIEQNPPPPSSILSQGMPFLSPHDCEVLKDAMGSLSNISQASGSMILQSTSLSKEDSYKVSNFFVQDAIVFQ